MDKVRLLKKSIQLLFVSMLCLLLFLLFTLFFYNDETKHLGKGYIYNEETGTIYNKRHRKVIVPAKIISYKKECGYLYVTQQPLEHDPNEILYDTVYYYENGGGYYYWIINMNANSVLGPLDSMEFMKKMDEINPPQ